eukprot:70860-Lingulodinium_polyedra.AAC.1
MPAGPGRLRRGQRARACARGSRAGSDGVRAAPSAARCGVRSWAPLTGSILAGSASSGAAAAPVAAGFAP